MPDTCDGTGPRRFRCGATITLLAICNPTHRQSYLNIAAVTMAAAMVALITLIALGTFFGSF